jgi:hypothetical protein
LGKKARYRKSRTILITHAARFNRLSWKYSSIAYSLILKNVVTSGVNFTENQRFEIARLCGV